MKKLIKSTFLLVGFVPCLFHIVLYMLTNANGGGGKLKDDLLHYKKRKGLNGNNLFCLVYLLLKFKEFRNIFYWRVGMWSKYILFWLPELNTLRIWTKSCNCDGGLYIGHGWGTVINAKKLEEIAL